MAHLRQPCQLDTLKRVKTLLALLPLKWCPTLRSHLYRLQKLHELSRAVFGQNVAMVYVKRSNKCSYERAYCSRQCTGRVRVRSRPSIGFIKRCCAFWTITRPSTANTARLAYHQQSASDDVCISARPAFSTSNNDGRILLSLPTC